MIKRIYSTLTIVLFLFINSYSAEELYNSNSKTFDNTFDDLDLNKNESISRNYSKDNENTKTSTYFCTSLTKNVIKFFSYFNNFDISTRISRVSSLKPFYWELDGATTFRISFFKIFKHHRFLENNFIFEINFNKIRDLGGRGFDFLERRLGKNIILNDKDEKNDDKQFASGAYFFGLLNKNIMFFSVGVESNLIYKNIFNTNFIKSGFGLRFPIWSSGIFGLVNNLNVNKTGAQNDKDKGCKKWSNLSEKQPLQGILYNIIFYVKPLIYEFDNGFRIDITWENCINDYRYMFYEIHKSKNSKNNISVFNIYNTKKDRNCFFRTISYFKNIILLKFKLEIGFNITKLI